MDKKKLRRPYETESPDQESPLKTGFRRSSRLQSQSVASSSNDTDMSSFRSNTLDESTDDGSMTSIKKPFRKKVGEATRILDISAALSEDNITEDSLPSPPMKEPFNKRSGQPSLADLSFQESVVSEDISTPSFRKPFSRKPFLVSSAPIDLQKEESVLEMELSSPDTSFRRPFTVCKENRGRALDEISFTKSSQDSPGTGSDVNFRKPFAVRAVNRRDAMPDISFAESEKSIGLNDSRGEESVSEMDSSSNNNDFRRPFAIRAVSKKDSLDDISFAESEKSVGMSDSISSTTTPKRKPFQRPVAGADGREMVNFSIQYASTEEVGTPLSGVSESSSPISPKKRPFGKKNNGGPNFTLQYASSDSVASPLSDSLSASPQKRPFAKKCSGVPNLTIQYASPDSVVSPMTDMLPVSPLTSMESLAEDDASATSISACVSLEDTSPASSKKRLFKEKQLIPSVSLQFEASDTGESPGASSDTNNSPMKRLFRKSGRLSSQKANNPTMDLEYADSEYSQTSSKLNNSCESSTSSVDPQTPASVPELDETSNCAEVRKSFRESNRTTSKSMELSEFEKSHRNSSAAMTEKVPLKGNYQDANSFPHSTNDHDLQPDGMLDGSQMSEGHDVGRSHGSHHFPEISLLKRTTFANSHCDEISAANLCLLPHATESALNLDASPTITRSPQFQKEEGTPKRTGSPSGQAPNTRNRKSQKEPLVNESNLNLDASSTITRLSTKGSRIRTSSPIKRTPITRNRKSQKEPLVKKLFRRNLLQKSFPDISYAESEQSYRESSQEESLQSPSSSESSVARERTLSSESNSEDSEEHFDDEETPELEAPIKSTAATPTKILSENGDSGENLLGNISTKQDNAQTETPVRSLINSSLTRNRSRSSAPLEVIVDGSEKGTPNRISPERANSFRRGLDMSIQGSQQKETSLPVVPNTSRSRSSACSENIFDGSGPATPNRSSLVTRKGSSQVSTRKVTSINEENKTYINRSSSRVSDDLAREPESSYFEETTSNGRSSTDGSPASSLRRSSRRLTRSANLDTELWDINNTANSRTSDLTIGIAKSKRKLFSRRTTNIPLPDISYLESEPSCREKSSLEVSEKSSTLIESESENESDEESEKISEKSCTVNVSESKDAPEKESVEEEESRVDSTNKDNESISERIIEDLSEKENLSFHDSPGKESNIQEESNDEDKSCLDYTAPADQLSAVADDSDYLTPTPVGECTVLPVGTPFVASFQANASVINPENVRNPYLKALYSNPLQRADWAVIEEDQRKLREWMESVKENAKRKIQEDKEKWNKLFASIGQKRKARAPVPVGSPPKRVKKPSPVRLFKPARWANAKLYKYLSDRLEPEFGVRKMLEAEKVVLAIHEAVKLVVRSKDYEKEAVDELKRSLAGRKIVRTTLDFYAFIRQFLPREFEEKVVPSVQPVSNIVWPPKDGHKRENEPIL